MTRLPTLSLPLLLSPLLAVWACATAQPTQPPEQTPTTPMATSSTTSPSPPSPPSTVTALPAEFAGATVVTDDGSFHVGDVVGAPGAGQISAGTVIRLEHDLVVHRLWSGPDRKYNGFPNNFGSWWSAGDFEGSVADYRRHYAICTAWNDLTWAMECTLKAGTTVVVGPGQSVSSSTCCGAFSDAADKARCEAAGEAYPAAPDHWQIYLHEAYKRVAKTPGEVGDLIDCKPAKIEGDLQSVRFTAP